MPFEIKKFDTLQEFIDYNVDYFFKNYYVFYQMTSIIDKILKGSEYKFIKLFTFDFDNESKLICIHTNFGYLLYGEFIESPDFIYALNNEIKLNELKGVQFIGNKNLLTVLFNLNEINFEIIKTRIIYECDKVSPVKQVEGKIQMAQTSNQLELSEMSFEYQKEEYGENSFRDYEYMSKFIADAIKDNTILIITENNIIYSMLQLTVFGGYGYIGHLFTKKEFRGKGYATNLVHFATKKLLENNYDKVGLVSDSLNSKSNRIFSKINYRPIYDTMTILNR